MEGPVKVQVRSTVEYQGKVSEPADLLNTLTHLSRIKDLPIEEIARITTANAGTFFGIR
ncbi:MAG: TatD family hydrolase [Desulfobacterales bacterium]